jgi:hypothetical protein
VDDLLSHPAYQAAGLPFVVALVLAVLLRRSRQLGLPIAAAFACAVALTMGFGLESLTSLKKLVLVASPSLQSARCSRARTFNRDGSIAWR